MNVLTELTTLEIRGPPSRNIQIVIDEPLSSIQNVNFEYIQLSGSETFKRTSNSVHPSEIFDYVPDSEKVTYNVSVELEVEEEVEILPYDVYIMEIKKSQMPSFFGWNDMEVLRIHNCKLDELHWEMFDGLAHLEHLSLEHNEIKIVPAFAFYGALHIKTLSLAHNFILDLNYRSLAGLLDLQHLDLSHNSISKLSELTFPPFPNLRSIDFRNNPIKYVFTDTFGVMNRTETLYIGSENVQLELSTTHPFKPLTELRFLSISNAFVESLGQNVFKGLHKVEVLKLQGNISKVEFDAFIEMPSLRELHMSNCTLDEISMDAFIGCTNLKIIDLSSNNLSYIPPGLLDDQTELAEIYLQENRLSYLPSNFFSNPNLKLARLNGNPWKCSCDMTTWDPNITNQRRTLSQERCIREFHTGKVVSCRTVDVYKFDHKLAPRCRNVKNRTVYYALRKELKCISRKRTIKNHPRNIDTAKFNRKYKLLEKKQNRHKSKVASNQPISRKARLRVVNDVGSTKDLNSLRHLSLNNNADAHDKNSVLGNIDSYESFNFI